MDSNYFLEITDQDKTSLKKIAQKIFEGDKGILATDESIATLEKKFVPLKIENSYENRLKFRECLYNTPSIEKYISGVIINEEAFSQCCSNNNRLVDYLTKKNILLGLKVDKGLMDYGQGQKISVGLEDLDSRINEEQYKEVSFTKWRSFFDISDISKLSDECITQNCITLCKFAFISQKNGKVPVIEPEVGYCGSNTAKEMHYIAKKIYSTLFKYLNEFNIFIPGIILKLSFITPGQQSDENIDLEAIAKINIKVIKESTSCAIAGIVYLSGGHDTYESADLLSAIQKHKTELPVPMSFSFGRALTSEPLKIWQGFDKNQTQAREAFIFALTKIHKANQ